MCSTLEMGSQILMATPSIWSAFWLHMLSLHLSSLPNVRHATRSLGDCLPAEVGSQKFSGCSILHISSPQSHSFLLARFHDIVL